MVKTSALYHGGNSATATQLRPGPDGIVWLTPNLQVAKQHADGNWRSGSPTIWSVALRGGASVLHLFDAENPLVQEIRHRLGQEGGGWDSRCTPELLKAEPWIAKFLLGKGVAAVWVHDTPEDSLALLSTRALLSATPAPAHEPLT